MFGALEFGEAEFAEDFVVAGPPASSSTYFASDGVVTCFVTADRGPTVYSAFDSEATVTSYVAGDRAVTVATAHDASVTVYTLSDRTI